MGKRHKIHAGLLDSVRPYFWCAAIALFLSLTGCTASQTSHYTENTKLRSIEITQPAMTVSQPPGLLPVRLGTPYPANQDSQLMLTGQAKDGPPGKSKDKSEDKAGSVLPSPAELAKKGFTLDQIINMTLLADPKIRVGLEAINQANADLRTSSLIPNPNLFSDIQLLPLTRPFTFREQGGPPQMDHQVGFPIDWFLFGKRAAAMASAAAGVRISEAEYADLVRQRVKDTATAYYDALEATALLDLARQDLENMQRIEAVTRKAVVSYGHASVELNRAQLNVLKSEQSLNEAEKGLAVAQANLRARLGRRDHDPTFAIAGDLEAPRTPQSLSLETALAEAEQNRPDILALHLQVEKAARDIKVEKTKAFPILTPVFGYTRQFQESIGFPDASSWSAAVTTTLPLFDRNQGNIAKARSILATKNIDLESGLVNLRAEIEKEMKEMETAYRTATLVGKEQQVAAQKALNSTLHTYENAGHVLKGNETPASTLLEVLDAQRTYHDTCRLYITSRANYWRSVYRLNAAMGKQVLH